MEWPTVLLSAGISAVVGAVVSLLAVSQVTTRRARAERADASRRALAAVVGPLRSDLRKYQLGMNRGLQRGPATAQLDDHRLVSGILAASSDLPWWRRRLVERRCRRVFGDHWTDLARDWPYDPSSVGAALGPSLMAGIRAGKNGQSAAPVAGLIHRAYTNAPGHVLLQQLDRQLRLLAAAL